MCKLDYYGNIDYILAATDLLRGCSYTILHGYGYWYQYGNTICIGYGYETIYEVLGNIASTYSIVFICWYKFFMNISTVKLRTGKRALSIGHNDSWMYCLIVN